jgi:hypothetical protein
MADLLLHLSLAHEDMDLLDYMILATATRHAIETMVLDPKMREAFGRDPAPPQSTYRPIKVTELARLTRLPHETVRRRVKALSEQGWFTPDGKGTFAIRSGGVASPRLQRNLIVQHEMVLRYLARLEELGVKIPESY